MTIVIFRCPSYNTIPSEREREPLNRKNIISFDWSINTSRFDLSTTVFWLIFSWEYSLIFLIVDSNQLNSTIQSEQINTKRNSTNTKSISTLTFQFLTQINYRQIIYINNIQIRTIRKKKKIMTKCDMKIEQIITTIYQQHISNNNSNNTYSTFINTINITIRNTISTYQSHNKYFIQQLIINIWKFILFYSILFYYTNSIVTVKAIDGNQNNIQYSIYLFFFVLYIHWKYIHVHVHIHIDILLQ